MKKVQHLKITLVVIALALFCLTCHADERAYSNKIIFPTDAGKDLKAAIDDAAATLRQITDTEFATGSEYGAAGIQLIRSAAPEAPADAVKLLAGRGREPFVIRSSPTRLVIISNADDGLQHGLYFYLDQIGVRWFFPSDKWTIIPKRADIRLKIDRLVAPAFKSRTFFGTGGFGKPGTNRNYDPKDEVPGRWAAWQRRNRFGGEFAIRGHAGEDFNLRHKATLMEHPEYLAEVDGKRQPWSLGVKWNVSNPDITQLFVDDRLAIYRDLQKRLPNTAASFAVSVEPADGLAYCNCAECKKIGNGSTSDQIYYLANQVARAVKTEFPDGHVSVLAYGDHAGVPSFDVEPNVYVMLVPYAFLRVGLMPEEFIESWSGKVPAMGVYDYWSIPDWAQSLPTLDYLHTPVQKIRFWNEHGINAFAAESSYSSGAAGLPLYLASRLTWDPKTDADAVLADFYSKAFGAAAPPMKRMLERWATGFMLGEVELGASYQDILEARRLAAGDAAVLARVTDYGRYLHYIRLWYEYRSHPSQATDTTPNPYTLALLDYMWNIYDSAMIEPFRLTQLISFDRFDPQACKDSGTTQGWYKEGWKNIHQLTDEEIGKLMEEGSQKYPPRDFTRRVFGGKMVPALSGHDNDTPAAPPVVMYYASAVRFEISVPPGMKTLSLPITTGWDLPVKLRDSNEKVLWQATVPAGPLAPGPDNWEKHLKPLEIPIPSPGRYSLTMWNEKKMFGMQPPSGVKFTMMGFTNSQGRPAPRLYFYVPRGTKTVAFTMGYFMVPKVFDSTGKEWTPQVNIPGIYEVAVPPGEDGKIWSLGDVKAPFPLAMMNVPHCFAFSPEALMVPEEALR